MCFWLHFYWFAGCLYCLRSVARLLQLVEYCHAQGHRFLVRVRLQGFSLHALIRLMFWDLIGCCWTWTWWFKVVHASEHGHRVPDRSSSRVGVCQGLQTGRTSPGTCHCLLLIRQDIHVTGRRSFSCEDVEFLFVITALQIRFTMCLHAYFQVTGEQFLWWLFQRFATRRAALSETPAPATLLVSLMCPCQWRWAHVLLSYY